MLLGLSELGTEVIKAFFIPKIRPIGERIEPFLDGAPLTNAERIAATHIKQLFIVNLIFVCSILLCVICLTLAESYDSDSKGHASATGQRG